MAALIPPRPDQGLGAGYHSPQVDVAVRLNTNESPYPPPQAWVDELAAAVTAIAFNRYPDRSATALRAGLAELHGVRPEQVFAANGSNEVLQVLLLTYGGPGRSVAVFEPTYALHSHIARLTGTAVATGDRAPDFTLDPGEVKRVLADADPAVTFLCSPNNPTGRADPRAVVTDVVDLAPGLVVVDEAYGEFGGESAVTLLPQYERLVVVRSFSKSWRMAGARIGYLMSHPWLVEAIQVARLPYHLSAITQAAGETALKHAGAIMAGVQEILVERERLIKEMERVPGLEVFPSDANFVLFRSPRDGTDLHRALAEHGVLVRDFNTVIPRALRVTVGTSDQNADFVEALRSVLTDG